MPRYKKIVLDTVTISNFVKIGKLDLVCKLYCHCLYITEAVAIELAEGNIDVTAWIESGRIRKAELSYDTEIRKDVSNGLADGEISCIIYGVKTNCAIATDDKVARETIRNIYQHGKLTGTIGLLNGLVEEKLITGQYARALLEEMIEKGFWYKGHIPF